MKQKHHTIAVTKDDNTIYITLLPNQRTKYQGGMVVNGETKEVFLEQLETEIIDELGGS